MFIGIPLGVLRDLMTSKGGALYEPVDIRGVRPSLSRTRDGGLGLSFTAATR